LRDELPNGRGFGKEGFGKEGFGKEGFGKEGFGKEGWGVDNYPEYRVATITAWIVPKATRIAP